MYAGLTLRLNYFIALHGTAPISGSMGYYVMEESLFKGDFWKPCPGTGGGYLCCGYQILTPQRGCGLYCRYCILQVYFKRKKNVIYRNYIELERELSRKMALWKGVVRFGTGEFTDSLFAEDTLGLSRKIAGTLEPYNNAIVEFKTKSANIAGLEKIRRPERVVIGFSVNTPRMIALFEKGTASLDQRLEAVRKCEEMGFSVAFHFDPMFWYDGWKGEYQEVVRAIYAHVKEPRRIIWCSLGGFRTTPILKKHLREINEHLPLFSGEMISGDDGKLRYFRKYRVEMYSALLEEFERHDPGVTLYLCMESREIWEKTGLFDRISGNLAQYLDKRAEEVLKKPRN
jgi:spore photoproduct lyase